VDIEAIAVTVVALTVQTSAVHINLVIIKFISILAKRAILKLTPNLGYESSPPA
jgi:hypothetical protein